MNVKSRVSVSSHDCHQYHIGATNEINLVIKSSIVTTGIITVYLKTYLSLAVRGWTVGTSERGSQHGC